MLKSSTAVDQDVYVVTKEFSEKNGVTSLADLKKITDGVTVAGFSELEERAYGPKGLRSLRRQVQGVQAVRLGRADGRGAERGQDPGGRPLHHRQRDQPQRLVQLEDPKPMILPQNVIPLVRSEVAENTTATAALDAVQAALTTEDLIALNNKVDDDRQDPDQVATDWLTSKGLA